MHDIDLKIRPSRSSSKNGTVERNNGTFKRVLDRLQLEQTIASPATLVARASFFTNIFHGSAVLSSFQLARGYQPSILGIPSSLATSELLDVHTKLTASRALQKVLRSRVPTTHARNALPPGTQVWVFYNTSKQNDPTR